MVLIDYNINESLMNTTHFDTKKNKNFLFKLTFFIVFFLQACSGPKIDPVTGKEEVFEPNADERAKRYARENPIFIIGGENKKRNEVEFATSNVLWRATLKSLDFLPLSNVDYNAGVIIYDWYSKENNSQEQIKISVQFLSNEIRSDSIYIKAHKKICDSLNKCSNSGVDENFASTIKENIISTARTLKIEENKKNKK